MTEPTGYVFGGGHADERARLALVEATYDEQTVAVLCRLGVAPGWRCLEVGGGSGSMTRWLAARVGPSGHVLVTDLDLSLLADVAAPNVEVRRHDVVRDALPMAAFDLVHARLVLEHIPERDAVVPKLAAAVRPGGWLLVEDMGFPPRALMDGDDPRQLRLSRWQAIFRAAVEARGWDMGFGNRLPRLLLAAGLAEVGGELRARMWRGGDPAAQIIRQGLLRVRDGLIAAGTITAAETDAVLEVLDDPTMLGALAPLVSAWGRQP